ncbi:dUTPase-like protein, partial [Dimargaris cristalligena]
MFDFEIRHIKGVDNPVADALSRLPVKPLATPPHTSQLKIFARDDVPLPKLRHLADAGIDVVTRVDVRFEPGEATRVPTGLYCTPPEGTYIRVADRSSMALQGFRVGGGVIDPGYTGEICVIISNETNRVQDLRQGDRVAQLILERFAKPDVIRVPKEAILGDRRGAGFGSTGVN